MIPAKADPAVQDAYLDTELEPRLTEAQTGQRAVFFVDAAHFVLAPFLGFLGSVARLFIQAPCGRQRFNVLAALRPFQKKAPSSTAWRDLDEPFAQTGKAM